MWGAVLAAGALAGLVQIESGTECPSVEQVRMQLEAQISLSQPPAISRVALERVDDTVRVDLYDENGKALGSRFIRGSSCEALATAVAVVVGTWHEVKADLIAPPVLARLPKPKALARVAKA